MLQLADDSHGPALRGDFVPFRDVDDDNLDTMNTACFATTLALFTANLSNIPLKREDVVLANTCGDAGGTRAGRPKIPLWGGARETRGGLGDAGRQYGRTTWLVVGLSVRPTHRLRAMDRNSLPRPGCMVALLGDAPGHLQLVVSLGGVPQLLENGNIHTVLDHPPLKTVLLFPLACRTAQLPVRF